jgi:hypothetical protein
MPAIGAENIGFFSFSVPIRMNFVRRLLLNFWAFYHFDIGMQIKMAVLGENKSPTNRILYTKSA